MDTELTDQEKQFICQALRLVPISGTVGEVGAIVAQIDNIISKLHVPELPAPNGVIETSTMPGGEED